MFINNRLLLFWKIGKNVFLSQKRYENVISKCSDLCSYHYGMTETFSRENIRYMRQFYECFPIYLPEFNKLDWEHYIELIKIRDLKERYFYLKATIFCSGSVVELRDIIKRNIYNII